MLVQFLGLAKRGNGVMARAGRQTVESLTLGEIQTEELNRDTQFERTASPKWEVSESHRRAIGHFFDVG